MPKQEEWNNSKNILCVRLDNLGDVLMTSPAIRALKNSVPGRKISLLASSAGSQIAKYIPEIDEVLTFDTPWEKTKAESAQSIAKITGILRERSFDAAVIFNVYSQSPLPAAMLCYMAGINRIAGYCRENPYRLISDWIPDKEPLYTIKHEVQRQLDLVSELGAATDENSFSLTIPENADKTIHVKLNELDIHPGEKIVLIHPGVSEAKRQYPASGFAEAANMIVEKLNCKVLLTGTESEKPLTNFISTFSTKDTYDLAGQLQLEEFIALIKNSTLLISNNTGPAHIAAAVQTPVVVLYALTNPQHAPWNVRHSVLPFEIAPEMRSKNVIIQYANQKTFQQPAEPVIPAQIVMAAENLMHDKKTSKLSHVLYL